jgi:adenylate cyclase
MGKFNFRQKLVPTLLGLVITIAATALPESSRPFAQKMIERLEGVAYDLRLNQSLPEQVAPDPRIVIVTVDEKSLAEIGHWPWSRDKVARLTDTIFESNALVVGFDIMFAEPQANTAARLLSTIDATPADKKRLAATLIPYADQFDYDRILADSFRDRDVVLGYTFHSEMTPGRRPLPAPLLGRDNVDWNIGTIRTMPAYTTSTPLLQEAALGNAFVTTLPDSDGILRRTPMLMRYGGKLYGGLALEMARLYFLLDDITINTGAIGDLALPESISMGSVTIPIDATGQALIPYRGPSPAFPYVSASDVLNGNFDPAVFDNRLVLVGATALGLGDIVASPVQNIYPGVEVHASLLSGILDESFAAQPPWAAGANIFLTLVVGGVLALLMPWLAAIPLLMVGLLSVSGLVVANFWYWQQHHLVLTLALPVTLFFFLTLINLTWGFLSESRQRGRLHDMFGHYVPPQLVDTMMQKPEAFNSEGESRTMTVLFADIRSFTTISESLHPNDLKKLLNQFFGHMTKIIFDNHGTIDKYVGDMIMAFWGAPVPDDRHALHATLAAMQMLAKVKEIKPQMQAQGLPEINIGIGLNTGTMNVGDMGSEYRRAYTVLGDAVNLASRLEGLTKFYGAGLVIGEETYDQIKDMVLCRKLDRVRVKGKSTGIEVFQPLALHEASSPQQKTAMEAHHAALDCYWNQQWDDAQQRFQDLHQAHPDDAIYTLYLERIEQLRGKDLGNWDGVYERRSK